MKKLGKCGGCGVKTTMVYVTVECPNCGGLRKAMINVSSLGEFKE